MLSKPAPTSTPVPTEDKLCGGLLTQPNGTFHTPGWPHNYPSKDFQCEWRVEVASPGSVIEFRIDETDYGINGRSPCSTDSLEFFDGLERSAPSLSKVCEFMNPGPIRTTSHRGLVVFTGTVNDDRPASRVGVRVEYTTRRP